MTFTKDTEKESIAKEICRLGVFTETVVKNRMIEMDEQGFLYYQSIIIDYVDYVDSLTFNEARECVRQDDEQSKTLTCRRST